jgi:glycerate 2-kinase
MHVVIAPDSFKGSLSAGEAAAAIRSGVLAAHPEATARAIPLSDGGEGFATVLCHALGGAVHEATVTGPLGEATPASWVLLANGRTAILESAEAIGLGLAKRRVPAETTTQGVGELVRRALDAGARTIAVGLGGTATIDGGAGAAAALGVTFRGASLPIRGGRLGELVSLDATTRDPRLGTVTLLGLTDVDNPLTGSNGAAHVYGPQKGATPGDVAMLDRALSHLCALAGDPGNSPGDGAAGGLGYGLRVLLGGSLRSGIEFVLDQVGFDAALDGADLVITGEGRLDAQTTHGKVVSGVVARASARKVPVIALVGSAAQGADALLTHGLTAYHAIRDIATTDQDAMERAALLLETLARDVITAWIRRG